MYVNFNFENYFCFYTIEAISRKTSLIKNNTNELTAQY